MKAHAERRGHYPLKGNGNNKTAGAKHTVANRFIAEISED